MFYYVGINKKRIGCQNIFSGYITLDGEDSDFKAVGANYNDPKDTQKVSDFYERKMNQVLKKDPDAKFIFYNPYGYYFLKNKSRFNCLGVNKKKLLFDLFDKFKQQKMFKNEANFLEYKFLKGKDVSFAKCAELFNSGDDEEFVVQQNSGYAGFGTFYLSRQNEKKILPQLDEKRKYRVSIFQRNNTSVNSTVLIADNCVKIFKPSIQNISVGEILSYEGANFQIESVLTETMREEIGNLSKKIANRLKKLGYRGIFGVDAIFVKEKLFFMECNARFQASSTFINDRLVEKGFPSLYELNLMCFEKNSKLSEFDFSTVY